MRFKNPEKTIKIIVIAMALYLIGFSIAMAFFPIRPFWNDEWRLIYNLKFKNISQLWGTLDLLQECPRVYLTLLKEFTSFFDYSYISLRMPALIIGIINIMLIFNLRKKIGILNPIYSYLFILILISSQTLTDYMVQVKHYEMEILACLLALWQLLTFLKLSEEGIAGNKSSYFLLCISCLVVPYFSYTYPIAIAPVFPVMLLNVFVSKRNRKQPDIKSQSVIWLFLPLILVSVSVVIFYFIDVKRLMADTRMYQSYLRVLHNEKGEKHFFLDLWYLFALVGSGFVYEIVFGILGIASFFYGIYKLTTIKKYVITKEDYLQLYGILLLVITLYLFLSSKILGGVARLTAYTVPSIAILIVSFLSQLRHKYARLTDLVALALFLGLIGNIISTCIANFTYPEYVNRIITYRNTSEALKEARLAKIPVLYTDGLDGDTRDVNAPAPGKIQSNTITPEQIAGADVLCPEVILKVNPEYKVWDPIPVYYIPDTKWLSNYMQQLPPQYTSAIAGDGVNYVTLQR